MMTPIEFFAQGLPKGQPRVKARVMGAHAGVYTPSTADEWKACVALAAKPFIPSVKLACPLCVNITFYFPRLKGHYRKDGTLKPNAPLLCTSKPDKDNLEKAVFDVLTAAGMWVDDALICDGWTKKRYANGASGARIVITEVCNERA